MGHKRIAPITQGNKKHGRETVRAISLPHRNDLRLILSQNGFTGIVMCSLSQLIPVSRDKTNINTNVSIFRCLQTKVLDTV
jgi:hypothetical protein